MKKRYHKYKDSGIDWLGEIPEHWVLNKIKHIFRVFNGATPKSNEPEFWGGDVCWVTPEDLGNLDGTVINSTSRKITQEGYQSCGTTLVPAGSLVLSTRAPIGHIAQTGVPLCSNQGCRTLAFKRNVNHKYFFYQILCAKPCLQSWGQGSTFMELSKDRLEMIFLAYPPEIEQQEIASFLNNQTMKIDALLSKKEKQIELLKEKRAAVITRSVTKGLDPNVPMKDSGIEWLGEIPAHWEVKKLKFFGDIVLGKMVTPTDKGDYIRKPYLNAQNIRWEILDATEINEMWFSENELRQYRIKFDDLLVSEGGEVGRTAIWCNEIDECYIQNSINKVTMKIGFNPRYFLYMFESYGNMGHFNAIVSRVSIAHLTREKLKEIKFIVPPDAEQKAIAVFLDQETSGIDKLINQIQSSIDKLREYRTALISAAVTGKIDVRGE
jgi:type I restriction enzyme S subunit